MAPAFAPVGPGLAKQDAAVLEIGSAQLAMLPVNAFFTGTGTVIANIDDGASFDGSQYTFIPGSNVSFEIYGGAGDGVSLMGTSNDDLIKFGDGNQSATGGGGADRFQVGAGVGTITDFTLGIDRIDLSETGITGMERLGDFLTQGPKGAQISGVSSGVVRQINLQGIDATSLTAGDFLFNPGFQSTFDAGTAFDDIIFGFGFFDQMSGGDGNDRIYTGGGLDIINGDAGNDTVIVDGPIGFGFQSILDGGSDYDTLQIRQSGGFPLSENASGAFLLPVAISNFENLRFDTKAGQNLQVLLSDVQISGFSSITGGDGQDYLVIGPNDSPTNTYSIPVLNLVNWSADDLVILAMGNRTNDNTLNSISHSGLYVLNGGGGNDTFNGTSSDELMLGQDGNDTFHGNGGTDYIDGGIGTDKAVFAGQRSSYAVAAGQNGEVLIGSARVANVEEFLFDDGKYTWDGTQLVPDNRPPVANADTTGVDEDATAAGNLLANDSTGETNPASADAIALVSVGGQAIGAGLTIQGSYGTLSVGSDGSWSYVADADLLDALQPGLTLTESFDYTIADSFGVTASSALTVNVSTIADVVTVNLGNGDDRFTATAADELINGGRGNDILNGLAGSDRLYGGNGEDRLFGGDGWDLLVGGLGEDRLYGDNGNDVLIGGRADDLLFGGAGADTFEFGSFSGARDRIGDFELGVDSIHLSDGITITATSVSGGNTTLALSSGGSIQLMGVTGISDVAALLTSDLPDWTDGLLLA